MTALQLKDIKNFMNLFLRGEVFDHFLMPEAVITQDVAITINGRVKKDYFSGEELEEMGLNGVEAMPYALLRPRIYQLIRGKKTPLYFKFVLMLSPANMEKTLSCSDSALTCNDVSGMFFQLTYQNGGLILTTGISYKTFVTDKTLDREWDEMAKKFLVKNHMDFEEL